MTTLIGTLIGLVLLAYCLLQILDRVNWGDYFYRLCNHNRSPRRRPYAPAQSGRGSWSIKGDGFLS